MNKEERAENRRVRKVLAQQAYDIATEHDIDLEMYLEHQASGNAVTGNGSPLAIKCHSVQNCNPKENQS